MILSLDSNVIVDVLRGGREHVRARLDGALAAGVPLFVSSIVVQELAFGAHMSARPDHHLKLLDRFLSTVFVEPMTHDDAVVIGRVRAELEQSGLRLKAVDVLIAGQAVARDWTLVTADLKHFAPVEGLRLLDWSDPAGPRELIGGVSHLAARLLKNPP